jgi:uncharacterized protein (TIGR03382 family)
VFHRNTWINRLFSVAFLLVIAGCGDLGGGCGGCGLTALPEGGLPRDQTVEGGGQIRLTAQGFDRIASVVPSLLDSLLGEGVCIDRGSILGTGYCVDTLPACGRPACQAKLSLAALDIEPLGSGTLRLHVNADIDAPIRIDPLIGSNCTLTASATYNPSNGQRGFGFDAEVTFTIKPDTGELDFSVSRVHSLDLADVDIASDGSFACGGLEILGDLARIIIDSFLGDWIIDAFLRPTITNLVKGFLPDPLGIANRLDLGALLGGAIPGIEASLEARFVPGGYVQTSNGGLSLGLITGINADRDIATRTADLDSEPALCVPPFQAPALGAAPASLPTTARGTFSLLPAEEFLGGQFEPPTDLAIGISETTLDLGGHHAVTSGALCAAIGTDLVDLLNVGTLGILVPSLNDLVSPEGKEPVLLALRPQNPMDLSVGEGTAASPAIKVHVEDMEADFYAFVYERYVRVFTMSLTLDIELNLEFNQVPGQPATIKPLLKTIEASDVAIEVLNHEFVRESKDTIKGVLPTVMKLVLDLIPGLLSNPIEVPNFAGFTLTNLQLRKVTTPSDDFLAIYASLGSLTPALAALAPEVAAREEALAEAEAPAIVKSEATLRDVIVPTAATIRAGVARARGGETPSVSFDVATHDALGRELEWTWNLNDGIWHDFTSQSPLVIGGDSFVLQGKYSIGLRSRVKGDYRTTDPVGLRFPVLIDSEAPRIWAAEAKIENGALVVPVGDVVSGTKVLVAYGRPGDREPWTDWRAPGGLDLATVKDLSVDGAIVVFAKDEAGNVAQEPVTSNFHGQAEGGGGCSSCDATGSGPTSSGIALVLLTALLVFRRRAAALARAFARSRGPAMLGLGLGVGVVSSLVPGCSCGSNSGGPISCELDDDCTAGCPADAIPLCFDNQCLCVDDVPYGRIGPFSDVDVAANGDAYVSAYAESHGDLVVARHSGDGRIDNDEWEFVDGVPAGPVVIQGSNIRGGITAPGEDVGVYTSIQVGADDTPVVAYFDRSNGGLKFAGKFGGAWQSHTVDDGTGSIDAELGGEITGMYASMSVRTDDGRPGIAYMALTSAGGGITTSEVRFAAATTPTPTTASDWQVYVVDKLALPPVDPANPDVVPLPEGLGLFVDAARDAQQAPVVAYYDRINGDLKMARFDAEGGQFRTPEILDGAGADVGWYPAVAVDATGVAHVVYQNAAKDDLLYIDSGARSPQVVDSGYRTVGTTESGLPKPELHIVGSDSNIVLTTAGPMVVYQDSTTHELLVAKKDGGAWTYAAIAGHEEPFVGAFGFFASAVFTGQDLVISNWVIDQPSREQWVQIHRQTVVVE